MSTIFCSCYGALTNVPKVKTKILNAYTFTNQGAGASGYFSVDTSSLGVTSEKVISVITTTGAISDSHGLQITFIYYGNNTLYFNYYQPKVITETISIAIKVAYIE